MSPEAPAPISWPVRVLYPHSTQMSASLAMEAVQFGHMLDGVAPGAADSCPARSARRSSLAAGIGRDFADIADGAGFDTADGADFGTASGWAHFGHLMRFPRAAAGTRNFPPHWHLMATLSCVSATNGSFGAWLEDCA